MSAIYALQRINGNSRPVLYIVVPDHRENDGGLVITVPPHFVLYWMSFEYGVLSSLGCPSSPRRREREHLSRQGIVALSVGSFALWSFESSRKWS